VVDQILERKIDIFHGYAEWRDIGFALTSEVGESGRETYHQVSSVHSKYDYKRTDKQFDKCLKDKGFGITISTFFHHAKQAGLDIITKETKLIVTLSMWAKRQGREQDSVIKQIDQFYPHIKDHETSVIVNKAFSNKFSASKDDDISKTQQLHMYLLSNCNLRKNSISRQIEAAGIEIDRYYINSVWNQVKIAIDENIRYSDVSGAIDSDLTPIYNPFFEFIEQHNNRKPNGCLKALAACIETTTGFEEDGAFEVNFALDFITKWYLGIISSIHGKYSPLLLALVGKGNTGKTEFFRRLLPYQLKKYYAESKLDAGKDDYILMCQKLIIIDDELGGRELKDYNKMKDITSKQEFTLREPYGTNNVTLPRLSMLGGTSNEESLLNDPTGNRRIIPLRVLTIDHKAYNAINKTDLFMEVYWLYKNGASPDLTQAQISTLNQNTTEFEVVNFGGELISMVIKLPEENDITQDLTTTAIVELIQANTTQRNLKHNKIGLELKKLGFIKRTVREGKKTLKKWLVVLKNNVHSRSEEN